MELRLRRIAKKDNYTIGKLYINSVYFADTIEDKDRGLTSAMALEEIKKIKVPSKTAIPTGIYRVTLNVISPKFSTNTFYKTYANNGRVPRLLEVKGFEGVLIHCGNTERDSAGCIIIGQNKQVGKVLNSKETFKKFYPLLLEANKKGETITLTIE